MRVEQLSPVGEKLIGVKKPRKKLQSYQQWQVENRSVLKTEVQARWQKKIDDVADATKEGDHILPAFRQAVARDMFGQLDEETQGEYEKRAAEVAAKERKEFEEKQKNAPIRSPETLQSCVA